MIEVFKIKNTSTNEIELIDFGIVIFPSAIEELEDPNKALLSSELNTYLQNGDLQRLINDVSVSYNEAFYTTTEVYGFDSSTVDASINKLFSQDLTINASLGIRVLRTLFDSSILSLANKDLAQDASIILRPLTTYVDGSLNLKVNRTLFDSSILTLTNIKSDKTYVDSSLSLRDASIIKLFNQDIIQDSSIVILKNYNIIQDGSIASKVSKSGDSMTGPLYIDASLNITGNLRSSKFELGSDLTIYPIVGNQSSIKSWWGLQLRGNSQNNLTTSPISIGNSNDFGVVVITDSAYLPANATLSVVGGTGQTSALQTWKNVGLTNVASISPDGAANFASDVSVGGSLRIGNDSSIGTDLPYACIDVSNGNKIVKAGNYYGQNFQYAESLSESTTTSTTPQIKVTLTTPASLPLGTYKITAVAKGRVASTSSDMRFRVYQGVTPLGTTNINIEPQDTASYYPIVMVHYLTISGAQTFTFRYSSENNGTTTYIVDATLELIRVN